MRDRLVCGIHAGLADPAAAARSRAENRRLRLVQAEERVLERKLGLRAALSSQLQRQQAQVEAAVQHLLDAAAAGDTKAAASLLPWIDQALGKPLVREEQTRMVTGDLSALDDEQLAQLVAEGRRKRLHEAG